MDEPTPPVRFTRTADGVSIAYMAWPGVGVPFLQVRALGAVPMALGMTMGRLAMGSFREFAGDRPFVWFDWRGTGQSARQQPTSMDDLLLDIDAVMSVIDSKVVDVVGMNNCFVACTYAVSRGERWRSLMLHDPTLRVDGSPQGVLTRPGWEADYEGFLASMVRGFFPPMSSEETERIVRAYAESVPLEAWGASQSILEKIDLTETLGALDLPVLILKIFPRSRADSVAALIRNSVLLERRHGGLSRRLREHWDQHIGSQFTDPPQAVTADPGLTRRECEIIGLIARGESNAGIAARLSVSNRTVERHVQNIYRKIGAHNRAEATRWALEHGVG